jgi:hypothetical protein
MTHNLREAYLATDFLFEANGEQHTVRIGEINAKLYELLIQHDVQGAAFITACNPASVQLTALANQLAMHALKNEAALVQYHVFTGQGQARDGNWEPEASLMVMGIPREQAEALGRCYGQNAIVWIEQSGMPKLIELVDLI